MTAALGAAVLLLLGVALSKLGFSDDLTLYVRNSARPWVLSAGILMIGLALWSLVSSLRTRTAAAPHAGHDRPGGSAWVVLAPVLALLVVAPPALGAFTAHRAASATTAIAGRDPQLATGRSAVTVSMSDFFLLSKREPASLTGRTVNLVGFADGRAADGFDLARLVITCCAADAFSVTAHVVTPVAAPTDDTWLRVTGTYAGQDSDGTPRLRASQVVRIPAPANPYD